jgi:agmatine deiminase
LIGAARRPTWRGLTKGEGMSLSIPPEWAPHRAIWMGFPSHPELWEEDLEPARREVAALARALAGPGRERVRLLACGQDAMAAAKALLANVYGVELMGARFGDIWLRDTGPIFTADQRAIGFDFNGWGGKYILEGDEEIEVQMADAAGAALLHHDFVLEGGAIDHDGRGCLVTTRQCLLNPNRNPGWDQAGAEQALRDTLGARKVLWLGEGLINDHTDGHVDNLARFVAPGVVACPMSYGNDDPNAGVYDAAAAELSSMSDADGRPFEVVRIPSPGRIVDDAGEPIAASHMNFVIANGAVIAPVYDEEMAGRFALEALRRLFPDRQVIGLPSRAILTGGGSFHCITQQEPA